MPVHVDVALPRVEGDTVHFAWTQDAPNPLQTVNGFWYRYDGLDLTRISPALFLEILLAIQLPIWKQQDKEVAVTLPLAMPEGSIDFWQAYHQAGHVSIGPTRPGHTFSPWSGALYQPHHHQVAMHFGAGKDSLSTACLAGEVVGRDQVLLLRAHDPLSRDPAAHQRAHDRLRTLSLDPLEKIGFATQEYYTNYSSIAVDGRYDEVRAGYEKFTVASLPALLAHGAQISSLGISWVEFSHRVDADGNRRPALARWRPEGLLALSRHYQRVFGFDHIVCSLTMLLVDAATYRLLFERYPDALPWVLACNVGRKERWCHGCPKCFHLARNSLAARTLASGFDFDRFFTSPYLEGIFAEIEQTQTLQPRENAAYLERVRKQVTSPAHYPDLLNVCSLIDPMAAIDVLSDRGMKNLALTLRYFGNAFDPRVTVVPREAVDRLPQPLASQMAAIASTIAPIAEQVIGPFHAGKRIYHYALGETFPLPILEVEHIR